MSAKIPVSAIICEFDPLHFGHKLVLDAARAAGGLVCCVMSGQFTQRAAPAMLDKWARARLALENGADLVVELPLSWACAGAERFAAGGVALAAALGADTLWFGSECPDTAALCRLADALLSPAFSQALADQPQQGATFAGRRQQAVSRLLGAGDAALLALPNANLGVEYIKAIRRQNAPIRPSPILRQGAGHGRETPLGAAPGGGKRPSPPILSAGQLRDILRAGGTLDGLAPESTARAVALARAQGRCPASLERLERAVLCQLRALPPQAFSALPDMSEGLDHRLYRAARQAGSLEELYALAKSRRYSHARMRRLVLAAFLGLRAPLPPLPPYLRVLGMGPRGHKILGQGPLGLPVVARPKDLKKLPGEAQETFQAEARAGDLYGLACPVAQPAGEDFTRPVVRV